MLVLGHIDPLALKPYAFHLKPCPLLQRGLELQLDLAAGPYHPLPRQRTGRRLMQQLRHLTMVERISRGRRDLRVRGYLATWNLADGSAESGIPPLALGRPRRL